MFLRFSDLYLCIQGADLHEQIGDVECNSLTLYIKVIFNEIEKKFLVSIIIVVFMGSRFHPILVTWFLVVFGYE